MKKATKIDVHGISVPGPTRAESHDQFAIATLNKSMRVHQTNLSIDDDSRVYGQSHGHLFLVANGLDDGSDIDRANGSCVDSVVQYFLNEMPWFHLADGKPEEVLLALEEALENYQEELLDKVESGRVEKAAMVTLAFVSWPELYVAHVGHNRCYLKRQRALHQLTTDHAGAQFGLGGEKDGVAQTKEALPRPIGDQVTTRPPEAWHVSLEPGDVLALVTDGIAKGESDRELKAILDPEIPAEQACRRLVDGSTHQARTAIVVRFLPHEEIGAELASETPRPPLEVAKSPPAPCGPGTAWSGTARWEPGDAVATKRPRRAAPEQHLEAPGDPDSPTPEVPPEIPRRDPPSEPVPYPRRPPEVPPEEPQEAPPREIPPQIPPRRRGPGEPSGWAGTLPFPPEPEASGRTQIPNSAVRGRLRSLVCVFTNRLG